LGDWDAGFVYLEPVLGSIVIITGAVDVHVKGGLITHTIPHLDITVLVRLQLIGIWIKTGIPSTRPAGGGVISQYE
jgi:hypothetical protein